MTEERKQLIELLEPYMDKTLSDGCLVYYNNIYYKLNKGDTYIDKDNEYKQGLKTLNYINYLYSNQVKIGLLKDCKILGHYDLSVVLKYIISAKNINGLIIEQYPSINKEEIIFEYRGSGIARFLKILNKPLHLYTQEEETILLKLLKDLGQN